MTKSLHFSKELSFPLEAVTQKFDFMGQSGGGKTYDAMKLAELMLEAEAQIVVLDVPGVWKGLRSSADGKRPGFKVLLVGGDGADLPLNPSAGVLLADMVVDTGLSVIFDLSGLIGDDMLLFVTAFGQRLFERKMSNRTPLHIFIEECQEIIPEQIDNKLQVRCRAVTIRWMKIGRNYGIGWSAITQEPQAASKRAINLAGTIIAVRTIGFHERQALERWARSKAKSKEQLALMDVLPELEIGQALVWSPGWLRYAGIVHVLAKVTFDSSKTPEVGKARAQAKVVAAIDLEQLKQDMAALVQEAEAKDPAALQRKIVELQRQLAIKAAAAPPAAAKVETVEVPVSIRTELTHLDKSIGQLARIGDQLAQRQQVVVAALDNARTLLARTLAPRPPENRGRDVAARPPPRPPSGHVPARLPAAAAPPKGPSENNYSVITTGKLSEGGRKMLTALGEQPRPLSRGTLGILAGYSAKGGSFRREVASLKREGYVREEDGLVILTDLGLSQVTDAARATFERRTAADVLGWWYDKLGQKSGEARLLESIIDAWPASLTRAELGERAQVEPAGGSFRRCIAKLKKVGIVTEKGGQLAPAPALVQDGAA